MNLLPIEIIWTGDGFAANPVILKQIKRNDVAAVYERYHDGGTRYNGCEVFLIKNRFKGQALPGGMFEEEDREVYPSKGSFGKTAWHMNRVGALAKFEELSKAKTVVDVVEMNFPDGEFTVGELAEENEIEYITASNFVKENLKSGTVMFLREERRNAKGKLSKIYIKA